MKLLYPMSADVPGKRIEMPMNELWCFWMQQHDERLRKLWRTNPATEKTIAGFLDYCLLAFEEFPELIEDNHN